MASATKKAAPKRASKAATTKGGAAPTPTGATKKRPAEPTKARPRASASGVGVKPPTAAKLPAELAALPVATAYAETIPSALRYAWSATLAEVVSVAADEAKRQGDTPWSLEKKWNMPTLVFGGKNAMHVACFNRHVGIFMAPGILEGQERAIAPLRRTGITTSKACVRLTQSFIAEHGVPLSFVSKLAAASIRGLQETKTAPKPKARGLPPKPRMPVKTAGKKQRPKPATKKV